MPRGVRSHLINPRLSETSRMGPAIKAGLRFPAEASKAYMRWLLVVSATQMVDYVLKGHDFSRAANGVE